MSYTIELDDFPSFSVGQWDLPKELGCLIDEQESFCVDRNASGGWTVWVLNLEWDNPHEDPPYAGMEPDQLLPGD